MRTIRINITIQDILLVLLITFLIFPVTSCSKKISFLTSSVVPAARGNVKVKKANNNNVIKIRLRDLAEVGRLQSEKNTYIV